MTALTDRPPAHPSASGPAGQAVAALLFVDAVGDALITTLDALVTGSLLPQTLIVLDATDGHRAGAVCRAHQVAREVTVVVDEVPTGLGARAAYARTTGPQPATELPSGTSAVWLLAAGQVPAQDALRSLADALRRSPSTGVVGPKLVDLDDPRQLRSVGIAATRTGRVLSTPEPGQPDMGQFDGRADVLGVPAAGLLAEADLWTRLGGHQPALGDLGADLDLSWRAHLAGRRVLTVPTARVAAPASSDLAGAQADTPARRRAARRVALARCAWWTAPFLALWLALTSLLGGLAMLLAKRPRAAGAEVADLGALLDPWRTLAARWRGRRGTVVRRSDLRSLFVGPGEVARHVGDRLNPGQVTPQASFDTDPEADSLAHVVRDDAASAGGSLGGRLGRNPGLWSVLAAVVAAGFAWRGVVGGHLGALRSGLVGGQLLGGRVTSGTLFHDWWDGWSGSGLGADAPGGPASALLAGPAWVIAHVPFLGVTAPGGAAAAALVAATVPLAAWTAYVAGRVVTLQKWPRALVGLAWAASPVAAAAVLEGRLAALVALVLLPLVVAGTARLLGRGGRTTTAAATGLVAAALGAFVPALLVVLLVVLVAGVVLAPGAAKGRALLAAALPIGLLGPWGVDVAHHPAELLTGPGLLAYAGSAPSLSHLALLSPGPTGHYPWWAAAPVAGLAVVCLVRGRRRGLSLTLLGLVGVVGLAGALAVPRVRLGVVPLGQSGAGNVLVPWWGTAMLLALAGLLGVVLVGLSDLTLRRGRGGWAAVARWPAVAALVVVAVGGPALYGWGGIDGRLRAWTDPRPAIAADQAGAPQANRTLLLAPTPAGMGYRLVAAESPDLSVDLGTRGLDAGTDDGAGSPAAASAPAGTSAAAAAFTAPSPDLAAATIQLLLDGSTGVSGSDSSDAAPSARLVDLGVGFVGLGTRASAAMAQRLDATAGLVRMGSRGGYDYWRVQPPIASADSSVGAPRIRLVAGTTTTGVAVTGEHGATSTRVRAAATGTLLVSEPTAWVRHATVTVDGREVAAIGGRPAYAIPAGDHRLSITVDPEQPWWRFGQAALLLVGLYLALPTRRARRSS